MTDTIRLTVKQHKLVTDTEQSLLIDLPRLDGNIDSVSAVLLEGYQITGNVSAVPSEVVLELTGAGCDESGFICISQPNVPLQRIRANYVPVFPPGGEVSFDRSMQTLAFRPVLASNMNLAQCRLRLLRYDVARARYIEWTDWTEARLYLVMTAHQHHQTRVLVK
jgi:hypothetical protein